MRLGILGGSFNPIHLGHMGAAEQASLVLALDEVWFVPVREHPFGREKAPLLDGHTRIALIEGAVRYNPRFKAKDLELTRPGPSYTIDTLREIRASVPAGENVIFVILGIDAFVHIEKWREYRKVLELANFAVVSRPDSQFTLDDMKSIAGRLGFCYNGPTGNSQESNAPESKREYAERSSQFNSSSQAAISAARSENARNTNESNSVNQPKGGFHPRMVAEYRHTSGMSIFAIELSPINVSSSEIRRRVSTGRSIAGLVPDGMADTITEAYKHL